MHWRKSRISPQPLKPIVHPFELGSHLLFLFVALLPVALVGGMFLGCFVYVSLVSEPIEYQARLEAN